MAVEPVQIDFAARGVQETLRAFDRIEQRIVRMERAAANQSKTSSRERVQTTQRETTERERLYRRTYSTEEREASKARKKIEAEQKAAHRTELREVERKNREIERLEQYKLRVRLRFFDLEQKAAAKAAAAEIREHQKVAAERRKLLHERTGGFLERSAERGSRLGEIAGASLGIGGGFLLADVAKKQMDAQRQAALLVNLVTTGKAPPAGANVGNILGQAGQVGKELGMDRETMLSGALTYAKNARGGDFAGVMANMGFLGKMSKVTGTDINELAEAAGILKTQNADLTAQDQQQMLLNVYAQSKAGSMSMADTAKQIGTLASARTSFAGNMAANQSALIGLGQIARSEGDVGEAGTFVKDFALEIAHANKEFSKKTGKQLIKTDKFGRAASVESAVLDVFSGTKGNLSEINELFGKRGRAVFAGLSGGFIGAGGGKAGLEAVQKNMREVSGATMSMEDLERQNAVIDETDAQKFKSAMVNIEESLTTVLAPVLSKFASELKDHEADIEEVMKGIGETATFFMSHPFAGIGALVLASIAKDLAAAGIGMAVKSTLTALLAGASAPAATMGAMGSAVSRGLAAGGGAAGLGLGAMAAAGAVGGVLGAGAGVVLTNSAIADLSKRQGTGAMGTAQSGASAALFARKVREGTVTPEDIAAAQSQASKAKESAEKARGDIGSNPMGVLQTAMMGLSGHGQEMADETRRQQKRSFEESKRVLDEWTKALEEASAKLRTSVADKPQRDGPMPSRADPRHS
jgi:hypothetical protein